MEGGSVQTSLSLAHFVSALLHLRFFSFYITLSRLPHTGASQFHLVSSQGASIDSPLLYPKTKGEVEHEVRSARLGSG